MDGRAPRHAVLPGAADRCLAALEQSTDGTIPCLREAAATKNLLQREGWEACPGWHAAYEGARPARANGLTAPVHATRTRNLHYRDRVLLPALQPSSRALLRSQGGAHADAWLSAVPSEPALTLAPQAMQLALRRRLRLPLPLSPNRCCPSPGCGQQVDERSDLMGKSSLNNGSCAQPHRECQLTIADDLTWSFAAPRRGEAGALCCDATLVSPLALTGHPQPAAADTGGRAQGNGPHTRSLGSEVGERWNGEAGRFVQHLLRVRSQRAPPALRRAAAVGWSRRWWGILAVAVQEAVASTALGRAWPVPLRPCQRDEPPLERVLELAGPAASPSRLISQVGVTFKARAAKGPAWDSNSARDAGERTKVPSRQDCSGGGGRQGSFTAQCSEEAFSCGRRTGKDDGEGVGQKVGRPGDLTSSGARRGIQSEQDGEALGDSRVMVCRVVLCQAVVLDALVPELTGDEVIVAEKGSQPGEALVVGGEVQPPTGDDVDVIKEGEHGLPVKVAERVVLR
eukprot:s727_g3.t1